MGTCAARFKQVDWNDWLSYTTPRVVRIKNWRLGLTQYVLMTAIFIYVIIFNVVLDQRYRLKAVDVVGSTRLQLRAPSSAYALQPNETAYCDQATGFPSVPISPCVYLDSYDAVDPGLEQGALFVSTRITQLEQTLSPTCAGQPTPDCQYASVASSTFYVAEPEWSTLLIDHSFSSASLGITRSGTQMPGKIVDRKGNQLDPCDDYALMGRGWACDRNVVQVGHVSQGNVSGYDIVPLATLLRAAGISSLDQQAGSLPESYRYAGLVLVVTLQYRWVRGRGGMGRARGRWPCRMLTHAEPRCASCPQRLASAVQQLLRPDLGLLVRAGPQRDLLRVLVRGTGHLKRRVQVRAGGCAEAVGVG